MALWGLSFVCPSSGMLVVPSSKVTGADSVANRDLPNHVAALRGAGERFAAPSAEASTANPFLARAAALAVGVTVCALAKRPRAKGRERSGVPGFSGNYRVCAIARRSAEDGAAEGVEADEAAKLKADAEAKKADEAAKLKAEDARWAKLRADDDAKKAQEEVQKAEEEVKKKTEEAAPPSGATGSAEDPLLEEARAAAEAARYQLEAAKLRAEILAMETGAAQDRLQARAVRLLGSADAVGIGQAEMVARFKESEDLSLTDEQANRLALAVGQGQSAKSAAFNLAPVPIFFRFADLASEAFDRELKSIESEMRVIREEAARQVAQMEAQERQRVAAETNRSQQQSSSTSDSSSSGGNNQTEEVVNEDLSTQTRILGALAYLLPLAEGFKFAIPLITMFPPLALVLGPVAIVAVGLNALPFGTLLVFVAFIFLAQSKENVPRLIRFNLEQAVLLDIALTLPGLILAALEQSGSADAVLIGGGLTFIGLLAACLYCAATTLNGETPDGIPILGSTTKNVIDRQTFFEGGGDQNKK
ncbi:unnamed protein product [Polarella glacialis]|uniref:TIC20 protein n=1 Tax=Polarella glacialis TaxID=89957 RepID=A0A813DP43_POLGL|nr:unnamed protein product [Polarella glacialis]|mmetsp:Transcript_52939/g.85696  ORF Transcript_52939/g.85696 Transcript_52939/m.85696 type:complete len:534 (-) Transcript_52939:279-1880(-)|eukprot:CAMPEP_0115067114 /NCGR_PEP_ID=MMETSP0227-20121206/11200_1 /TAXON_ID=89957 /ORGANISM="Polarella glacialis, Strain CCMP 1383" /LENGTH=533 /DNA_ID=CAMNT_0002453125 /DNA_START=110 /DNA_END=1711 /DNA_ORIENTATION=+